VPKRTDAGYHEFFAKEDFEPLFKALIIDKLSMGRIMGVLRADGDATAGDIAQKLHLDAAEVARHLSLLSQQGMVKLNGGQAQIAVAA
jgi:DNA-binding MarR family transcriptional regulator